MPNEHAVFALPTMIRLSESIVSWSVQCCVERAATVVELRSKNAPYSCETVPCRIEQSCIRYRGERRAFLVSPYGVAIAAWCGSCRVACFVVVLCTLGSQHGKALDSTSGTEEELLLLACSFHAAHNYKLNMICPQRSEKHRAQMQIAYKLRLWQCVMGGAQQRKKFREFGPAVPDTCAARGHVQESRGSHTGQSFDSVGAK